MLKISGRQRGITCILAAAFCFSLMGMFVHLAGDIPFIEKTFFRNIVAFSVSFVILVKSGEKVSLPKGSLKFLFFRAIAGTVGIFGNFYAVDHLFLSDAAMLNKMAPFFAILFSFFLLKEKIRPFQIIALVGAFAGAMLVAKPAFDFSKSLPAAAGFLGGMGAGFAYSCVRKLGNMKMNGKFIIVFFSAFSCLAAVPYMFYNFVPMTEMQLVALLLSGAAAAGGQFSVTAAYFAAPAKEISIYDYSQILFSALLGFVVFGQVPDILSIAGCLLIIAMALFMFIRGKNEHN
ncbi:MAG: DMT family transporter [Treponema sp.]|jgi:drug/metabolite transporter (DMT)-like permease|nr:DMT family transporter [Treponema sp.]